MPTNPPKYSMLSDQNTITEFATSNIGVTDIVNFNPKTAAISSNLGMLVAETGATFDFATTRQTVTNPIQYSAKSMWVHML